MTGFGGALSPSLVSLWESESELLWELRELDVRGRLWNAEPGPTLEFCGGRGCLNCGPDCLYSGPGGPGGTGGVNCGLDDPNCGPGGGGRGCRYGPGVRKGGTGGAPGLRSALNERERRIWPPGRPEGRVRA